MAIATVLVLSHALSGNDPNYHPMRDFRSPGAAGSKLDAKSLLARLVAREIQDRIAGEGLPVGAFLGRESDLQTRMHVSRPTLRAAIRYLEVGGRVATKVGVNGGVFVGEARLSPATVVLARHIVMLGQPLQVFFLVYMPFFAQVFALAAVNASESQRSRISEIAKRITMEEDSLAALRPSRLQMRHEILAATGFSAIRLVGAALFAGYSSILEGELKLGETEHKKVRLMKRAEAKIFSSLVASDRDGTLAAFNVAANLERALTLETIKAAMLPERSVPETLFALDPEAQQSSKLAEHVIRAMRRDLHHHPAVGVQSIGSISDLAARYGVSQEICREALGLLSLHGLVIVRRGRGGGVFASTPSLKLLHIVLDPEMRRCGGLQVLRDLLAGIRNGFESEHLLERDKLVTITFLDELIERVDVASQSATDPSHSHQKNVDQLARSVKTSRENL